MAPLHRADTWLVLHITQPGGCWLNSLSHFYASSQTQTVQAAVDKWAGTASLWPVACPRRAGGRAGTPVQACRRRAPPVCKSEHISAFVLPCTLFRSLILEQTGRAAFLFSSEVHVVVIRLMQKRLHWTVMYSAGSQYFRDYVPFGEIHTTVLPHALLLYLLAVTIKHDPTDVCPEWARGVVANEATAYEPQCFNNRKLRFFNEVISLDSSVSSTRCTFGLWHSWRSTAVFSKRPSVTAPLFVLSVKLT